MWRFAVFFPLLIFPAGAYVFPIYSKPLRSESRARVNDINAEDTFDDWLTLGKCQVLLPPLSSLVPKSIIHFIGGFLAGSAVNVGYSLMLRHLASKGHLIIATPIPPLEFDHGKVAVESLDAFVRCYDSVIRPSLGNVGNDVPIIGIGHSLGGKLLALCGSSPKSKLKLNYVSNIFISFNNFDARDSFEVSKKQASKLSPELKKIIDSFNYPEIKDVINAAKSSKIGQALFNNALQNPALGDIFTNVLSTQLDYFSDQITKVNQIEFNPNSTTTWNILSSYYRIKSNIIIKFNSDELDQSIELSSKIRKPNSIDIKLISLPGSHVTPNAISFDDPAVLTFLKELEFQLNKICDNHSENLNNNNRIQGGNILPPGTGGRSGLRRWDSDEY